MNLLQEEAVCRLASDDRGAGLASLEHRCRRTQVEARFLSTGSVTDNAPCVEVRKHLVLSDSNFRVRSRLRSALNPGSDELLFFRGERRLSFGRHVATVDHDPEKTVIERLDDRRLTRLSALFETGHRRQIKAALSSFAAVALSAPCLEERLKIRLKVRTGIRLSGLSQFELKRKQKRKGDQQSH